MKFYLDGCDWEADHFISLEEHVKWRDSGWVLHNMLLDHAAGAGFVNPDKPCKAAYTATIPGCDRSVLLENNVIADPYYGRNLEHSRWAENMSWAFRKRFVLPEEIKNKKRFQIHFCGIDYSAEFFLNGNWLGNHTGAFVPFEADVTDYIRRDGENLLAVIFDPIPKALPNHRTPFENAPSEFAEYHRSQMSYGWDWSRSMPAAGIWDHVYLNANDGARLTDCFFRAQGSGDVELSLDIMARKKDTFTVNIAVEPIGFEGRSYSFERELLLEYGSNTEVLHLQCPDAELWYPRGYGEQRLYRLTIIIDGEVTSKQVAFRTLEMLTNENSPEGAYDHTFCFNGRKVFARGVNWVPSDLMFSRCRAEGYERLIRLAAENGTNLFRVWGGGIIEKEEFYDACDRYGIIVWQEFMHACSNYRKDGEYLAFKAIEAEAILRKIRNHICVSMICGGNELQYYSEVPYSPLLEQYRKITAEFAPDLPYHYSCPDRSRPGERDHGPWHFIEHSVINAHDRLLASEVGCNGFTEYESLCKFIPERDLEEPESQSWKYHFAYCCRLQDWHAQAAVFDTENSAQLCQATMAIQGDINRYWMTHCRRKFPHTSGCFFWQYNEPWPTLSLSMVDYYSLPKTAYYQLARVQKSVILSLREDSWFCRDGRFKADLFLTADVAAEALEISFRLLTADGTELYKKEFSGSYQAGTLCLGNIAADIPATPAGGVVLAEMRIISGNELIFADTHLYGVPDFKEIFRSPKAAVDFSAKLLPAAEKGEKLLRVTLRNGNFAAFYLRLNMPGTDIHNIYWHDNYVTLAPGECRIITANITGDTEPEKLEISAWNLPAETVSISKN